MNLLLDTHVFLWWIDGDPFDRLLIAQAIARDYSLVSADAAFDAYPVKRLWT